MKRLISLLLAVTIMLAALPAHAIFWREGSTPIPFPTETPKPTATPAAKGGLPSTEVLKQRMQLWTSPYQHYYQQLSPEHISAWQYNMINVLAYPDQAAARSYDMRRQALASMIKHDNPRIFWIDWIDGYSLLRYETGNTATNAALIIPEGRTLQDMQDAYTRGVEKAASEINKSFSAKAGVKEKAKAIHDWICKNNSYNNAQTSSHKKDHDPVSFAYLAAHSSYSAIIPGDAYEPVCEGYAGAFKVLCDVFGIPCICVSGSTRFASGHMWNYVQLENGKWYLVDVTSDDGSKSFNHSYFLLDQSGSKKHQYTFNPYLTSGVNPSNGYSEGAAFTLPALAK